MPRLANMSAAPGKSADNAPNVIYSRIAYIRPIIAPILDVINVKGTSSIVFISLTSTIFSPPFISLIYNILLLNNKIIVLGTIIIQ